MKITLVLLIIDWLVLRANQQYLLSWHVLLMGWLVVRLNRGRQPDSYKAPQQSLWDKKGGIVKGRYCVICKRDKPERAAHCRRCNQCVFMMDHHCEWVGNCVSLYNSKIYLHLLLNAFIHSLVLVVVILWQWDSLLDGSSNAVYYWVSAIPAVYAIWESYRLLMDYHSNITNNQTLIESYKEVRGRQMQPLSNLKIHLGNECWEWLLPQFKTEKPNLSDPIFPLKSQVKEYVYADQYIDGSDSDQEQND